jgi:hypothetical protein
MFLLCKRTVLPAIVLPRQFPGWHHYSLRVTLQLVHAQRDCDELQKARPERHDGGDDMQTGTARGYGWIGHYAGRLDMKLYEFVIAASWGVLLVNKKLLFYMALR